MGSPGLSESNDADYPDVPARPDVKQHQDDHDRIADILNDFEADDFGSGAPTGKFLGETGGLWGAIDPPTSVPGEEGPPGADGQGFNFLQAYNPATTYVAYDVVTYQGNAFVALVGSTGSTPQVGSDGIGTASAQWYPFAVRGAQGVQGNPGQDGSNGQQGQPGPSAEALQAISGSGNITIDFAQGSFVELTLEGHATVTIESTSGVLVDKGGIYVIQGGDGDNLITWANVSWVNLGNIPPVLGTEPGDENFVGFNIIRGKVRGFTPGIDPDTGELPPIEEPPEVFIPIDLEAWADATDVDTSNLSGINSYQMGAATAQVGNKKGGLVLVITTRGDSIIPPIPTLSGAGASSWTPIISKPDGTAGTTRRRATLFAARDAVAGAASLLTVGLPDAAAAHTGCVTIGLKTTGIVSDTFINTMLANAAARTNVEAGSSSTVGLTLNAAADSENRTAFFLMAALDTAFTPESGLTILTNTTPMTSPTIEAWGGLYRDAFETTPAGTLAPSAIWVAIAVELEQGGTVVAPPAGFLPIDVESILVGFNTTDQTADYDTSSGFTASVGNPASVVVGTERLGIVDVVTTTGITADPSTPTLTGGDVTWAQAGTTVVGTGANRARITRFLAWDASPGAGSPLVVGVSGQATTGIEIQAWRSVGKVTEDEYDLALANTAVRAYTDAGEAAAGPARIAAGDPLDAARDSGSRVLATAIWRASSGTLGTVTPESGLDIKLETGMGGSPAVEMVAMATILSATYDTTPSATWSGGSLNWGIIATELGQAA